MKYEIGARIRKYREMSGFSQKELAQKIGVSNSRVSNWEQGINRPDADILADICKALNVSPSELLDVRLSPEDIQNIDRVVQQEPDITIDEIIDKLDLHVCNETVRKAVIKL